MPAATITNQTNGRQVGGTEQPDDFEANTLEKSGSNWAHRSRNPSGGANWQLPRGVSSGTWDYVRGRGIADGYDRFLENDPLTIVDRKVLDRYLPRLLDSNERDNRVGPLVADFGCGSGRHVLQLAYSGYQVLAVDLSWPMLNCLETKLQAADDMPSNVFLLQANLVELAGIRSATLDHAVCFFSTLGMIQGRQHRQLFLEHVRRLVKPGGQFVLHVHNLWFHARHPGGKRWLVANGLAALNGKTEWGDRFARYRGVNNMFIHSFRRCELRRDLAQAGFEQLEWFGIGAQQTEVRPVRWWNALGLVGWIVVAK